MKDVLGPAGKRSAESHHGDSPPSQRLHLDEKFRSAIWAAAAGPPPASSGSAWLPDRSLMTTTGAASSTLPLRRHDHLGVGALFFVRSSTHPPLSVVIRRVAEVLSSTFPVLFILAAAGVLIPILAGNHQLYAWSDPALVDGDHLMESKTGWLNPAFFAIRICVYYAIWTFLARYFFRKSVEQDDTGDPAVNDRLRVRSGPAIILFAFTTAGAGIDLLMTLAPKWYSTMFPVWFFAGSMVAIMALLALVPMALATAAWLTGTVEHYHDVGCRSASCLPTSRSHHAAVVRNLLRD
jgi:hypothetical protein